MQKRKLLPLILVIFTLILNLSACGNSESDNESQQPTCTTETNDLGHDCNDEYQYDENFQFINVQLPEEFLKCKHEIVTSHEQDLSDYGCCSGIIYYNTCEICKYNLFVNLKGLTCIPKFKAKCKFIDDDIHEAFYQGGCCVKCNLSFRTYKKIEENECQKNYIYYKYIFGETELEVYGNISNHEIYEETIELLGDSCSAGIKITKHCTTCGETTKTTYLNHYYKETKIENDCLEVYGYKCVGCDETKQITNIIHKCNFKKVSTKSNVNNYIETYKCNHSKYTMTKEYINVNENCRTYTTQITKYFKNDICIFESSFNFDFKGNHEYNDKSYTLIFGNCNEKAEYELKCNKCGHTEKHTSYHPYQYCEPIELAQFGMCGGYDSKSKCPLCESNNIKGIDDSSCTWETISSNENTATFYCNSCQTTKVVTTNKEIIKKCFGKITTLYQYIKNGNIVYESEYINAGYLHNFTCVYEEIGEYTNEYNSCQDCGYKQCDYYSKQNN